MGWQSRRWRFETRLSPEECAARLRAEIDGQSAIFGHRAVIGRISARGASLRKRSWIIKAPLSVFSARFRREFGRTVVECRLGMSYSTLSFLSFWCGVMLWSGSSWVVSALSYPSRGLGIAFIPLAMTGFAFAFVALAREMPRDEEAFMEQFLRRRLDAAREA